MTNQELIAKAVAEIESRAGYSYSSKALAEAIAEGLIDGDKIPVGGHAYATLTGDDVIFTQQQDGKMKEVNRTTFSELTGEQKDTLLKCKGKSRAFLETSVGRII